MINENSCYYFNIPSTIFQANLSRNAILVYVALASFTNRKDNKCYPSVSTLSKMIRLDRKYIYKAMTELVNAGLLVIEKRRGRTNIYELIPPKTLEIEKSAIKGKKEKKGGVFIPEPIRIELKQTTNELDNVIVKYLREKGEEYVLSNIRYTNRNAKNNYIGYLLNALKNDWAKDERKEMERQNVFERAKREYESLIGKSIVMNGKEYQISESGIVGDKDAVPVGYVLQEWNSWKPFLMKKLTKRDFLKSDGT